jgi:glycine cleavage system aminomethyltransferase T
VCVADLDVAVGTSVYAQFLNPRGGIEADVTITRIAQSKFLVVTGHPSQIRDRVWIEMHADPSWRFEIFDATAAFALLTIHGPKSREILQSLTRDDLSNAAFPFGAAREIDLAYARAWAIRRSFVGELGYELVVSTEFASGVYDAIMEAGLPAGLRLMGMFAMGSCRLEKAFRHFGHDIGEDDTPYETGLGFAVNLAKEANFLGKDVLAKQKQAGAATTFRTVAIAVEGAELQAGPYLIHNEPIWRGDELVGHVTSGGWGYRLRKMLGLASLHREEGVSKAWLDEGGFEVQVAGKRHPITVQLQPFYDPAGLRMRG